MVGCIGNVVNFSGPNVVPPISPIHPDAPVQCSPSHANALLVVVLSLVVDDVEELELVDATRGRDDAEPVTELLLLEELLGPANANTLVLSSLSTHDI